jgi:orotate phosphoribosyltransferase
MELYKQEFIEFMVRANVLRFGDFTTKSGRKTPFFINTGNYTTGHQLARLGDFYAQAIRNELGNGFDVLFGPAYKGIPLAVVTAVALADRYDQTVAYCFNRKEKKDHGEGGVFVGHALRDNDRVVVIEDVVTAGTSVRETMPLLLDAARVVVAGLVVSVDRMERGATPKSALDELREEFNLKAFAIVTIQEVTEYLHNREIDGKVVIDDRMMERIADYRKQYGAVS